MSEFRMLGMAFSTMLLASALSALMLYVLKVNDAVLLGVTTTIALGSYAGACIYCLPRVRRPHPEAEREKT